MNRLTEFKNMLLLINDRQRSVVYPKTTVEKREASSVMRSYDIN
jgi:hypothetical protein